MPSVDAPSLPPHRRSRRMLTPEPELAIFVACAAAIALSAGCDRNTKSTEELEAEAASAETDTAATGESTGSTKAAEADPHAGLDPNAVKAARPGADAPTGDPKAGGITWTASRPFVATPPASAMRAAQYAVGEGETAGELTVYHFPGQGGSVQANVDRWVGQFTGKNGKPAKDTAKVDRREVQGMKVTTIDVRGTYKPAQMPGMRASGPKEDYRLLGAIVEGPAGPVFFKLTGPSATLESAQGAFDALVASIRPAPAS